MKNISKIKTCLLATVMLLGVSCKLDTINQNAPIESDVLTTRSGIIGLSVGLRQYYSTAGIAASYFYPAVTSRELQGTATLPTFWNLKLVAPHYQRPTGAYSPFGPICRN